MQVQSSKACGCCGKAFKNDKEKKNCNFCALSYCSDCRYKQRAFYKPGSERRSRQSQSIANRKDIAKADKEERKGDICKVCDRKFFLKDIVSDKNLQIEAQTNQLLGPQGLNSQMEKSQE